MDVELRRDYGDLNFILVQKIGPLMNIFKGIFNRKKNKFEQDAVQRLKNVSAFARHKNNGKVPNHYKESDYVLGYYCMMTALLQRFHYDGSLSAEEQGLMLWRIISEALEMDIEVVAERIEPLMINPTDAFEEGRSDADKALVMLMDGDENAFVEFNVKTRSFTL